MHAPSSLYLLSLSVLLLLGFHLRLTAAANEFSPCYFDDGTRAKNFISCNDHAEEDTGCCHKGYACNSNTLCYNVKSGVSKEMISCTDETFNNPNCPGSCERDNPPDFCATKRRMQKDKRRLPEMDMVESKLADARAERKKKLAEMRDRVEGAKGGNPAPTQTMEKEKRQVDGIVDSVKDNVASQFRDGWDAAWGAARERLNQGTNKAGGGNNAPKATTVHNGPVSPETDPMVINDEDPQPQQPPQRPPQRPTPPPASIQEAPHSPPSKTTPINPAPPPPPTTRSNNPESTRQAQEPTNPSTSNPSNPSSSPNKPTSSHTSNKSNTSVIPSLTTTANPQSTSTQSQTNNPLPLPTPETSNNNKKALTTGIAVGLSTGLGIIFLLIVAFLIYRRRQRQQLLDIQAGLQLNPEQGGAMSASAAAVAAARSGDEKGPRLVSGSGRGPRPFSGLSTIAELRGCEPPRYELACAGVEGGEGGERGE
ncbi:hypothetical protein FQN55_000099 [Onygenales sp. PD_40]|nr:hypothetical protein FQN55_000099 [Onygenales sp. PD_40]KAK2783244.1 hypothetical protein FQN52_000345 [Onygenales sp. PD_12]